MFSIIAIVLGALGVWWLYSKSLNWAERQQPELARQYRDARNARAEKLAANKAAKARKFGDLTIEDDTIVSESKGRELEELSHWLRELVEAYGFQWHRQWTDEGAFIFQESKVGVISVIVECDCDYVQRGRDQDWFRKLVKIDVRIEWDMSFDEGLAPALKEAGAKFSRFDDFLIYAGNRVGSMKAVKPVLEKLLHMPGVIAQVQG